MEGLKPLNTSQEPNGSHGFRSQVTDFFGFLGRKTSFLMLGGVVTGLGTSIAELGLAYGLQSFLLALGIAKESAVRLPDFVPSTGIGPVLAFLFGATVLRGFFSCATFVLQTATNTYFSTLQRTRLLRWAFHSRSISTSELVTLFTERTQNAAGATMFIQSAVIQLTLVGFLGITLFNLSPKTTVISLCALLCFGWPIRAVSKKIKTAGEGLTQAWDLLNNRLIVSMKNLLLLRIYGVHEVERKRAQSHLDRYTHHQITQGFATGALGAAPQILGIGLICIIVAVGRNESELPSGVLLSYFYLFARLLQNLSQSMQAVSNIVFYWPQFGALIRWWKKHPDSDLEPSPPSEVNSNGVPPIMGWELNDVSFRYDPSVPFVLKNYSAAIPASRTTVISGPSGAGKSTILNLLLGQSHPTSGEVSVLLDAKKYPVENTLSNYMHSIGYVGPESFLIEGTLRENLCFGLQRKTSDDEIFSLADKAECQFIRNLADGLDHRLTEQGQGLSAGQKQRLGLLRALLRKPSVLILDEATSNLDTDTELRLISTLGSLKSDLTIVAVTHRKALLDIADFHLKISPIIVEGSPSS